MLTTETEQAKTELPLPQRAIIVTCFFLAAVVLVMLWLAPPFGYDWRVSFAPAGRDWLHPYRVPFHNPPWVAPLIWPLAILPARVGYVADGLLTIVVTVWLVHREGGSWLAVLVTLLSPAMVGALIVGNVELLPILGILIGGPWSVPLLATKPQTAGLAALLFFKRSKFEWRFWLPLAGVVAVSLVIWGWWPAKIPSLPEHAWTWNISIFPWGVPLGLLCVWLAWKGDALHWVLLAGLLFSPYLTFGSLTPTVAAWSARYPRAMGLLVAAFWAMVGLFILRWT